jgi:hypothetical protein
VQGGFVRGENESPRRILTRGFITWIGLGLIALAFLVGFVPGQIRIRQLERKSAQLEHQLQLAELRGQLGMMSYEANRNNYASAAELSSPFFDRVSRMMQDTTDGTLRSTFEAIIAQRGEVTSKLTHADPGVKEQLARMYAGLHRFIISRKMVGTSS